MSANTSLQVSDLDFFTIKQNLKNFLKNQSVFNDYDFDSSALSILLDILAYNTYYNSFYLNMVSNETFLDTAILRENIVSRAKELNYVPQSAQSSKTNISVTIAPDDNPSEILIPAYTTQFTTTVDGINYLFSTAEDYTVVPESNSYFKTITVYEGQVLNYTFNVDALPPNFEIPNPNLDVNSLIVKVKKNISDNNPVYYTKYDNLEDVKSDSEIYFVEENTNGNYNIYFGDNVLGKRPDVGNIVIITARFCSGSALNGISSFTLSGYIGYNKNNPTKQYAASTVNVLTDSFDGLDREDTSKIKFAAPKFFQMQNRLVTENDYKAYILSRWPDTEAISVWGGERNDPPYYGKVLISVKPKNVFTTSLSRKQEMVADLTKRCILSIDPIIVDPSFTFMNLQFLVTYDSNLTSLSQSQLYTLISNVISNYESIDLSSFNDEFRLSSLVSKINNIEASIINVEPTLLLEQRISPILNDKITYRLRFNSPSYHPYDGFLGTLTSTGFKVSGSDAVHYIDDDGYGNVRIYTLEGNNKIYAPDPIGTLNYSTGEILLKSLIITSVVENIDEIRIMIMPQNTLYKPLLNEILLLSNPQVTLFDQNINQITLIKTATVQGNLGTPIKSNRIFIPVPNPITT